MDRQLQTRLFPRVDDLACSYVVGFESPEDAETLMRLSNEVVASGMDGEWRDFSLDGFRFRAQRVADLDFEEGLSVTVEKIETQIDARTP